MKGTLAAAVIAAIALLGLAVAPAAARSICPRPVRIAGQLVSCDGTMPAPEPTGNSR